MNNPSEFTRVLPSECKEGVIYLCHYGRKWFESHIHKGFDKKHFVYVDSQQTMWVSDLDGIYLFNPNDVLPTTEKTTVSTNPRHINIGDLISYDDHYGIIENVLGQKKCSIFFGDGSRMHDVDRGDLTFIQVSDSPEHCNFQEIMGEEE